MILKSIIIGVIGAITLLGIYFLIVILVSGREFAINQFLDFWYFILSLTAGFGIQLGLYSYLKSALGSGTGSGKMVVVSGTTSTAAMISCCAHYLANILPIIGATGIISLIGQYQVEFFWIGLAFNVGGIVYIVSKVIASHPVRNKISNGIQQL